MHSINAATVAADVGEALSSPSATPTRDDDGPECVGAPFRLRYKNTGSCPDKLDVPLLDRCESLSSVCVCE